MTIYESTDILLRWFSANNSFNLEDNFKALLPNYVSDTPEADRASLILGLKEMQESKLVNVTQIDGKDYYVLMRPFNTMSQNVNMSAEGALIISEIINVATQMPDDPNREENIIINPLKLTEDDILLAIKLLSDLVKSNNSKRNNHQI